MNLDVQRKPTNQQGEAMTQFMIALTSLSHAGIVLNISAYINDVYRIEFLDEKTQECINLMAVHNCTNRQNKWLTSEIFQINKAVNDANSERVLSSPGEL